MIKDTLITFQQRQSLCADVLAYTVHKLFPQAQLLGGFSTKIGFYYDFIFAQNVNEDILAYIEVELKKAIKEDLEIRPVSMMRENAQGLMDHHGYPFLADLVGKNPTNIVDLVQFKQFTGLSSCEQPILSSEIGCVKLVHLMNDRKENESTGRELLVTRIVGVVRENPQELKQFIKKYDHYLKKTDHRQLLAQMNYIVPMQEFLEDGWIWLSKGLALRKKLFDLVDSIRSPKFYVEAFKTPEVVRSECRQGGEGNVLPLEGETSEYTLNKDRLRQCLSVVGKKINEGERLPLRLEEEILVFRTLSEAEEFGLLSCSFNHSLQTIVVCMKKELHNEVISFLHFIEKFFRILGFEAHWHYVIPEQKNRRQGMAFIDVLKQRIEGDHFHYPFYDRLEENENVNEPQIELRVTDQIGREWEIANITLVSATKADLGSLNVNKNNDEERVAILKISQWTSIERVIALLVEQNEGILPLGLAPEQARVLPFAGGNQLAQETVKKLKSQGVLVTLDVSEKRLGEKIHQAEKEKVPYLIILGEQEVRSGDLSVRSLRRGDRDRKLKVDVLAEELKHEMDSEERIKALES